MLSEGASRRTVLKGLLAGTALAAAGRLTGVAQAQEPALGFEELARVTDKTDHWPEGYRRQICSRWGDAIFPDSAGIRHRHARRPAAERQFGYNNDFTAFLPLPQG